MAHDSQPKGYVNRIYVRPRPYGLDDYYRSLCHVAAPAETLMGIKNSGWGQPSSHESGLNTVSAAFTY